MHDGLGMLGKSYRLPSVPIRAGDYGAPESIFTKIFEQQPVRSLIVSPPRCSMIRSRDVLISGKAWSGAGDVVRVEVSWDTGATWKRALLASPSNKWAWQQWSCNISLPSTGVWDVLARATDSTGATQPMLVPPWNPGGYGNNQVMKVDLEVVGT